MGDSRSGTPDLNILQMDDRVTQQDTKGVLYGGLHRQQHCFESQDIVYGIAKLLTSKFAPYRGADSQHHLALQIDTQKLRIHTK